MKLKTEVATIFRGTFASVRDCPQDPIKQLTVCRDRVLDILSDYGIANKERKGSEPDIEIGPSDMELAITQSKTQKLLKELGMTDRKAEVFAQALMTYVIKEIHK